MKEGRYRRKKGRKGWCEGKEKRRKKKQRKEKSKEGRKKIRI